MPRVGFNLSDKTAQRLKEYALKRTGSMKGLSEIGEEAIVEYLKKHEKEFSESGKPRKASTVA